MKRSCALAVSQALMCPETAEDEVDRHTDVLGDAVAALTGQAAGPAGPVTSAAPQRALRP